jgi:hypothetical protein
MRIQLFCLLLAVAGGCDSLRPGRPVANNPLPRAPIAPDISPAQNPQAEKIQTAAAS